VVYSAELKVFATVRFKIIRIYAQCAPRTQTQALRRRRHWLLAALAIDWSNCAHSSIRRVLSSSASAILLSAIFSANENNLMLIITALCNNVEHLRLTR